ncbi:putative transcriptional regulator [Symbiobacterium terraclitae]|uniref:Transcriptional regulator n=1 Tax=Symbiobacterium terraclitae TaxID=557451 RepID=A0ABS4JSC7_9FIRM|nr:putative transcriptional regulator [Symbiobacterium terraclitae]
MAKDEIVAKYELRNRLRAARIEQHLSQQELADMAGVTRQTISAIENCQYVPSTLLAFVLARCLGKAVTELFYLEEVTGDEKARC